MRNNILKNVSLASGEKIEKEFLKLRGLGRNCQILLTTKRLVIYTSGAQIAKGKRVRRKMMSETDISTIHQFEYYIDYSRNHFIIRIIGLLLFLAGGFLAYYYYAGYPLPAIPYQEYAYYGISAIVLLIGLSIVFKWKKALTVKIKSGLNNVSMLSLKATRYNELAIRYLSSKIG